MEFEEVRAIAVGEIYPRLVDINEQVSMIEHRVAKHEVIIREQIARALAAAVGEIEKILTIKFNDMSIQVSEEEFHEILGAAIRELG